MSTLTDWVGASAATWVPLVEAIAAHVFAARRLHADDTPVPVLATDQTRTGRLWTDVRDDRPFAGRALLDGLSIPQAHIVGSVTGANVALNFAIAHPRLTKSAVIAGGGAGSTDRERWLKAMHQMAADIAQTAPGRSCEVSRERRGARPCDPRIQEAGGSSSPSPVNCRRGAELMMLGVLVRRKPVAEPEALALESSLFVGRKAPHAALAVFPLTGHTLRSRSQIFSTALRGGPLGGRVRSTGFLAIQ